MRYFIMILLTYHTMKQSVPSVADLQHRHHPSRTLGRSTHLQEVSVKSLPPLTLRGGVFVCYELSRSDNVAANIKC